MAEPDTTPQQEPRTEPAAALGTQPRRRRFRILLLVFLILLAVVIGLLVFWPYYARRPLGSLKLKQCPQKLIAALTGITPGSRDLSHASIQESYILHGHKYDPHDFNTAWVKAHCKVPLETAPLSPSNKT